MNQAEQSTLVFFDEPSIAFDFNNNGWRAYDEDAYSQRVGDLGSTGLGQSACPECAYLSEGRCNWCSEETKNYPECLDCVPTESGRAMRKTPWFKRADIVTPVLTGVAVTVTATVITTIVMRRLKLKG